MDLYSRVFSHDVMAAILVSPNNETAAMLVSQTSPLGVELFSYAPINVKPAGGRQGMGWGFDCLCCPWGRAFD